MRQEINHRRVYSSEEGRICPMCNRAKVHCTCGVKAVTIGKDIDGVIRIGRETRGRKGKGVTLVSGLPAGEILPVAKELKQLCGSGGTVKDGRIEIQGDHRESIFAFFAKKGCKVKKCGG